MEFKKISEFSGSYHWLSNFGEGKVTIFGLTFNNREAAFQAMKTKDVSERMKFTNLSPSDAKKLGRKIHLRLDWEEIKDDIMFIVVKSFFEQNKLMKYKLLNTGNLYLEEGNTWGDTYWGVCRGKGQNKLGVILMKVRDKLRAE